MKLKFAEQQGLEGFGDLLVDLTQETIKKYGKKLTQYQRKQLINKLVQEIMKQKGVSSTLEKTKLTNSVEKALDEEIVPALGAGYTEGMHANEQDEELCFSSEDEALQYLANVTGKSVKVAE